ncbi:phosphatidylserine synthase [Sporodiniella umbellata]|nr:phosphatidylserine synthase [Sporodiniella umbellata]
MASKNNKQQQQQTKQEHFSMVRNFYLADVITLMNGVCGVQSVLSSMRYLISHQSRDLSLAMVLMPLGMFFDFLDGRVARWRKNASILGQELDSLADLISFGVAPVALAYAVGMRTLLDGVCLSYFICCCIARLARYNVSVAMTPKDATGKVKYFEGTPTPTSLGLVACLAFAVHQERWVDTVVEVIPGASIHPFVLAYMISGTLMISKTLHIPKP